jgi:Tfp pilus assembly protein PilF
MAWDIKAPAEELALIMETGLIYRYSGKFAQAREVFEGVRALRPQNELPHIALGTVDFEEGRYEEAIQRYRKAITMNPRSAYAHAQLGEAQVFQGNKESARVSLEKAVELDPRSETANLARAMLTAIDRVDFKHN